MRRAIRSAVVAMVAIGASIVVAFTPAPSVVVALAATALYMGGTGHSLSVPQDTPAYISSYISSAEANFVAPSGLCTGGNPGCVPVAVYTPEQFRLDTGLWDMTFDESVAVGRENLDACLRGTPCTVTQPPYTTTGSESLTDTSYVVYGYSQSATIVAYEKNYLIAHPPIGTTVSFLATSNPNRPNGGILERFVGIYIPIIGVTFNGPTPTNSPEPTPLTTVDVTQQYDPVADFPTNPLNLLADLNVGLGFLYVPPEDAYFDAGTPQLQGQYQDTTYYLIPSKTLPLLMPLEQIPIIGPPLAQTLDPPLRVLVEAGYDRTINPGQPTAARFLYSPNPINTAINFLVAIPTGWDNGIAYITGNPANRPFHTTPQPTYGVGGPPVYTGAIDPYGPPTPSLATPPSARQPSPPAETAAAGTGRSARKPTVDEPTPASASVSPKPIRQPTRPKIRPSLRFQPNTTGAVHRFDDRPLRALAHGHLSAPRAPATGSPAGSTRAHDATGGTGRVAAQHRR